MELSTETVGALLSLTAMEIVLGIDNVVFISILAGRVPAEARARTVRIGLLGALVMRLGLLFTLSWLMGLDAELFRVFGLGFSGRELILLAGGLFLVGKATRELYTKVEASEHGTGAASSPVTRAGAMVVVQILLVDLVFSLDSVITAVGMANQLWVMVVAMVIAVGVMQVFALPVGRFVENHPSVKVLALAFLLLIGAMLVAEGLGTHIPKGTIYFAMAFSLGVELLNLRRSARARKGSPAGEHPPVPAPGMET